MRPSRLFHASAALALLIVGCSGEAVEADPQLIVGDPDALAADSQLAQDSAGGGQDGAGADGAATDSDAAASQDGITWGSDAATTGSDGITWGGDTSVGPDGIVWGSDAAVVGPDATQPQDTATVSDTSTANDTATSNDAGPTNDSATATDTSTAGTDATTPADVPGPTCGNGVCQQGENTQNCPADCSSTGGGQGTWTCGDAKCDIGEEFYCQADCLGPSCGDGVCKWPETSQACPADCKSSGGSGGGGWVCGDGKCDIGEQFYCQKDCQVQTTPEECLAAECASQLSKCQATSGCMDAVSCLQKCGASWNCAQGCFTGQPPSEVTSLLTCAASNGCF